MHHFITCSNVQVLTTLTVQFSPLILSHYFPYKNDNNVNLKRFLLHEGRVDDRLVDIMRKISDVCHRCKRGFFPAG